MYELSWIILATVVVSLISLIGIFTLGIKTKVLDKFIHYLVSLAIGGLLAGAFFHLIPEAATDISLEIVSVFILIGIFGFFGIEKLFHWRHCHHHNCENHSFAYTNLVGDSIHNFLDGLVIAAAFLIDVSAGFATTLAVLIHEIPQELGDFGVLVYAGFTKAKALFFNFITAITAVVGGILGFFLFDSFSFLLPYIISITAGGFIYISVSDLIPEIRKEQNVVKTALHILMILLGIIILFSLKFLD